jgi:hypothetical protein
VRLASRGQRDMDTGPEQIADPGELAQVRRQARVVHAKAASVAVVLTALSLLLPV